MDLTFTEMFWKESVAKLGVKEKSVREAFEAPEKKEELRFENDLVILFCWKTIKEVSNGLSILAYGRLFPDGHLEVQRALKVYPNLCPDVGSMRPTELLFEIASRFGVPITIGTLTARFFFHQKMSLHKSALLAEAQHKELFNVHLPPRTEAFQEFWYKWKPSGDMIEIDCALMYALDLGAYRAWILNH